MFADDAASRVLLFPTVYLPGPHEIPRMLHLSRRFGGVVNAIASNEPELDSYSTL
jgi:hypothetical protein